MLEDEEELLRSYERGLAPDYDVLAVASASAAEDRIDELGDDIDVALLDRRLPEASGDEVLRYVQAENVDCRTAMVTAVDPDFDIIDMGFDDYLVKPITPSDLATAIERLLKLDEYDEIYRKLSERRVKRSVLASEKSRTELRDSDEFARLQREIAALEAKLESIEDEIEDTPLPN